MYRYNRCARVSMAIGVLLVVAALGQESTPTAKTDAAVRIALGQPAPEFSLQSVNGETVRLADFRGQTVLIYFWATWCGPCKIMTPWFVDLQSKYAAKGFHVLAVSLDDDATRVEIGEFADQNHVNFPVLIGNEKIAELYGGVPAMPENILISVNGSIVERIIGLKSKSELEKSVRNALNSRAPSSSEAQK